MKEKHGGKCDFCDKRVDELQYCEICGAQGCYDCIKDGMCKDCRGLAEDLEGVFNAESKNKAL